jgi:hypothetical protein
MICRVCGCHDLDACVTIRGEVTYVCWWVATDLCSFCALSIPGEGRAPVRGVDDVIAVGGLL